MTGMYKFYIEHLFFCNIFENPISQVIEIHYHQNQLIYELLQNCIYSKLESKSYTKKKHLTPIPSLFLSKFIVFFIDKLSAFFLHHDRFLYK